MPRITRYFGVQSPQKRAEAPEPWNRLQNAQGEACSALVVRNASHSDAESHKYSLVSWATAAAPHRDTLNGPHNTSKPLSLMGHHRLFRRLTVACERLDVVLVDLKGPSAKSETACRVDTPASFALDLYHKGPHELDLVHVSLLGSPG